MNRPRRALSLLARSHFIIALAACVLSAETYLISHIRFDFLVLLVSFFGAWCIYNVAHLRFHFRNPAAFANIFFGLSGERIHILQGVISFLIVLAAASFLRPAQLEILALSSLLAFGYVMPITRSQQQLPGLRNIFVAKNIVLALVWTSVTVWLPLASAPQQIHPSVLLFMSLRRFFFVYSLALVFDIRDISDDSSEGLKTIAQSWGAQRTKFLALFALLCFSALVALDPALRSAPRHSIPMHFAAPLYLSAVLTAFFILGTNIRRSFHYYVVVLDGTMIAQFVLVLLFNFRGITS